MSNIKVTPLIDDDPNNPDYKARCIKLAEMVNELRVKISHLESEIVKLELKE